MSTTSVNITAAQVKELREKTNAPMMDCKNALTEAKGDMEAAVIILRKKGVATAAKKADRVTSEGSVASYIHAGGKIGVLVEVNCESDFVARTDDFKGLVHDIAMHIAASDPKFIRKEDVTPEAFEKEKDIYRAQAAQTGKPRGGGRKDRRRQDGQVLRGGLPVRAALHQGPDHDRVATYRYRDRQARREHLSQALRALQSGRRRRDHRRHQSRRGTERVIKSVENSNQTGRDEFPPFPFPCSDAEKCAGQGHKGSGSFRARRNAAPNFFSLFAPIPLISASASSVCGTARATSRNTES